MRSHRKSMTAEGERISFLQEWAPLYVTCSWVATLKHIYIETTLPGLSVIIKKRSWIPREESERIWGGSDVNTMYYIWNSWKAKMKMSKEYMRGLEMAQQLRHPLLFQKTWVRFPGPTWLLTTPASGNSALSSGLCRHYVYMVHRCARKWNTK